MTDAPVWTENLEPAGLVGEAFAVIGRTASVVMVLSLVVYVPLYLSFFAFGYLFSDAIDAIAAGDFTSRLSLTFIAAAILGGLVFMLGSSLVYAAITQVSLDDAAGRPVTFGAAMASGLSNVLPVTAVGIVAGAGAILAAVLLVLPGLYLMALWGLVVPIIVEERLALGSLGRSAALTEGYRWPMVGLVLLYLLVAVGVGMITSAPESLLAVAGVAGTVASALINILGDAFVSVFGTVVAALAYIRLRQIKEGGGPMVAEVFS